MFKLSNEEDAEKIRELIRASREIVDDEDRFRFLARPFVETATPYLRQMGVREKEVGVLHTDLSTFDCGSFAYILTAMYYARNFDEFVWALRTMRYRDGIVLPHHLIHFADNVMKTLLSAGIATDITDSLAPASAMRTLEVRLGMFENGEALYEAHRKPEFWEGEDTLYSGDSNVGQMVSLRYIHLSAILDIEPLLKCGDIIFMASARDPLEVPELITHVGCVYKFEGVSDKAFLLHSSLNEWSVVANRKGGVCIARFPEWSPPALRAKGDYCRLHDYFKAYARNFDGLIILRPYPTPQPNRGD